MASMHGVNKLRQRRFLPSMSLLTAFDAVVRNRSVSDAARELNLTQSTLSRLIQKLEAQLGRDLFVRQRRRLIPTDTALAYQKDLSDCLDVIQRASMAVVTNLDGGTLSLAVLPTFGMRWLAPRLSVFLRANPGITINLSTRIHRFSFATEPFDAVIYYGDGSWPDSRHMKLFDERLTACASSAFLTQHRVKSAEDVAGLPLIQLQSRPAEWKAWFAEQGSKLDRVQDAMLVDQFSIMIQAAIAGLGVALLPDYIAREEIGEGRLVPILNAAVAGPGAYWLAWSPDKEWSKPLAAFREWVGREVVIRRHDPQ